MHKVFPCRAGLALAMLPAVACSATSPPLALAPAGAVPTAAASGPGGAADLDGLIAAHWRARQVRPAPVAGDGEYLRRVSLDLVGRVPTLAEAQAFLAERAPDKRARLVDRLLGSPEFAEHWADVYSELLWRVEGAKRIERQDPRGWLVTAFAENWPYDRLATELVTATGDLRDNGAAAFVAARLRGGGGPEAVAGAAARIFLGLNIQCAQCHDHPYDTRWKQEDFYGLVAYFARARVKRSAADMDMMDARDVSFTVHEARRGEARMRAPRSQDEVVIAPRFLGRPPAAAEGEASSRRELLARTMVASDLFPKAMVARTWAQLFGAGIVDPWDDLGAENDQSHPAILNHLAAQLRRDKFDVKALVRRLVLSTAYQRSASPAAGAADDQGAALRAFARARVRPLAPGQLFRTLITATGVDEMARHRQREDRAERLLSQGLREYRFTFDDDEMADADFDGSMPQALLLLNGELTNRGARAAEGGVLGGILARARSPGERLEQMFLAVYARPPSEEERALLLPALERGGRDRRPYEDLYFALLTSTESVTNH